MGRLDSVSSLLSIVYLFISFYSWSLIHVETPVLVHHAMRLRRQRYARRAPSVRSARRSSNTPRPAPRPLVAPHFRRRVRVDCWSRSSAALRLRLRGGYSRRQHHAALARPRSRSELRPTDRRLQESNRFSPPAGARIGPLIPSTNVRPPFRAGILRVCTCIYWYGYSIYMYYLRA